MSAEAGLESRMNFLDHKDLHMSGVAPGKPIHVGLAIDTLTRIWERVLRQSPISAEDNFFDIGGDSLLAIALFLEIEKATGRQLPISTIYDAPTVASLAAVLEQATAPRFSPLVLLKPGADDVPPVFIVHGVGGSVMELSQLGKHIRSRHPVYGIQARGLDGVDAPKDRVEDMAQIYLDAITETQSHGPYLLVGNSFGGLVMLEVAQRLAERGEKIALLALLDTYPHPRYWPLKCWLAVLRRRAKHHATALRRLPFDGALPYIIRVCRGLMDHLRFRRGAYVRRWAAAADNEDNTIPPSLQRVRHSGIVAWAHYRPRYYRGKIIFMRAEVVTRGPDDPIVVWGRLVQNLEVHTMPGDHLGMSTVHAESLAAGLSHCLQKALG